MKRTAPRRAKNVARAKTSDLPSVAEWTILIYMAADNTLSEESVWALTELQNATLSEGVRVAVLFDSSANGMPTRIYKFGSTKSTTTGKSMKGQSNGLINAPRVRLLERGEDFSVKLNRRATQGISGNNAVGQTIESAADPRLLQTFIEEILSDPEFEARHYALIFSTHGSGAIGDFLTADHPRGALSIPDLGQSLREVTRCRYRASVDFKFDIIGMDSCLMSMAEVAYELHERAHYLVGSEGFAPETGWPYGAILEAVNRAASSRNSAATDLAREMAGAYIDYYADYVVAGTSVDQSVCDLGRIESFRDALGGLALTLTEKLTDAKSRDEIILAHWRAQSYKNEMYTDLWDFCDLLTRGSADDGLREKCRAVIDAIDGAGKDKSALVILSRYYGVEFQHSHGISIYFPWKKTVDLDEYQNLSLAIDTGWGKFLDRYVGETQREMRGTARTAKSLGTIREVAITAAEMVLAPVPVTPPEFRTPPANGRTPPANGRLTPVGRSNMKNSPTAFLIDVATGDELH